MDIKAVLWANVLALMQHKYGRENLTRLANDCNLGPGTATRLKQQTTSVGVDILSKLSDGLGVDPWQLLVPGLEATNPPVLRAPNASERALYARLDKLVHEAEALRDQVAPK